MLWSAIGVCVKFNDELFSLLTEKKAKNKASQLGEPFKSFNGVSLSFRRTVSTGLSTGEIQVETFRLKLSIWNFQPTLSAGQLIKFGDRSAFSRSSADHNNAPNKTTALNRFLNNETVNLTRAKWLTCARQRAPIMAERPAGTARIAAQRQSKLEVLKRLPTVFLKQLPKWTASVSKSRSSWCDRQANDGHSKQIDF